MATAKTIAADIGAISGKKEKLRKAFEELKAHASALASFTLEWKHLEEHVASIQKSIEGRLQELEAKEKEPSAPSKVASAPAAQNSDKEKIAPAPPEGEPEAEPRPELKSFCLKMDGKGLLRFICRNRKDILTIGKELNPAIRTASDPAKLVLDALKSFYPAAVAGEGPSEGELYATRRNCILLMERLLAISAEIKPLTREKAVVLAREWKAKMAQDGGKNYVEALGFLQLLASYKITAEYDADELLNLLIPVVKRKQAIDLCRNLGLSQKIPDFIQKLSEKGKFIGAVKFIYAFDLVDRFPPVPFLKEHVKESKKMAQEVRKKGNNSAQSKNEATAKEIAALMSVIKTINEYNLASEYPPESLQKRVAELEQQKPEKKRPAALTYPKASKRPRPLTSAAAAAAAAQLLPHYQHSQPHISLVDRSPYMPPTGPYGLSAGSYLYDRSGSAYGSNQLGLGGVLRSPPRPLRYADPLAGSSLYDRPSSYSGYSLSGGLPSQYNSSVYR